MCKAPPAQAPTVTVASAQASPAVARVVIAAPVIEKMIRGALPPTTQ